MMKMMMNTLMSLFPFLLLVSSLIATTTTAFQSNKYNNSFKKNVIQHQRQAPPPSSSSSFRDIITIMKSTMSSTMMIDIDENAPRDIATMQEWCTACGVQTSEGFQLSMTNNDNIDDSKHSDVQAVTTLDIPGGQPVLFVPSTMILRASTIRQEFGGDTTTGGLDAAEKLLSKRLESSEMPQDYLPLFYIFLKILYEAEQGDASPWYPWLNSLPRYFSNGSSMTEFCCTECLPPYVGRLANQERIRFIQFFRALRELQTTNTNTNMILKPSTIDNRALAKWAFAVASTRAFPDLQTGDLQLIPMADMFNHHGTTVEVQLNYDEEGNCYAYSTYDIPAGSPLRISYDNNDSTTHPSHLFAKYGFLDESAPATFCKLFIDDPSQELLNMGIYDHSKLLFYKDTGDVSEQVWDVLLYHVVLSGDNNGGDQQAFYNAHMTGDFETKQALHQAYFPQTKQALLDHVDTFLNTLQALNDKAQGRNLEIHPRLPLIMRHNDFVKNTFLLVRERVQQM